MSTSPSPSLAFTRVLPALAGFAAMTALGWSITGDEPVRALDDEVTRTDAIAKTDRGRAPSNKKGPPAEVARKLAAIRGTSDPVLRMQAVLDLANGLSIAEMAAWFEGGWPKGLPAFEQDLFRKVAMQRWRTADPYGHLEWSLRCSVEDARETVSLCVKADPKKALDFLREHQAHRSLEVQALRDFIQADPAGALAQLKDIASDPDRRAMSPQYLQNLQSLLRDLAVKSPRALAAGLEGLPSNIRVMAERALVWQEMESDFSAAIRKMQADPDGLSRLKDVLSTVGVALMSPPPDQLIPVLGSLAPEWRGVLVDKLSNMSAETAEKWLATDLAAAGFTAAEMLKIQNRAIRMTTWRDPEKALRLLDSLQAGAELRKEVLEGVFSDQRSEAANEKLLAMLASDAEREAARKQFDYRRKMQELKGMSAGEWLESISAKEDFSVFSRPTLPALDEAKLAELRSGFRELPADKKKVVAMQIAARGDIDKQVPELQREAIRYLIENPPANEKGSAASFNLQRTTSSFAVQWVLQEPEEATRWVQGLPEGSTKLWAQKNMAANWMSYDPAAASRWVDSLPAETRTAVKEFVAKPAGR